MPSMGYPAPIRTTCPYCGVGCGVTVSIAADGIQLSGVSLSPTLSRERERGQTNRYANITISGDPQHPANFGRLCSKGAALAETLDNEGRLLHPIVGGQRACWGDALDRVANGFKEIIAQHGT